MRKLQMIWWNVQRLFSPVPSPLSLSLDATSNKGWTKEAYDIKISAIASVLCQITGGITPALIGFAEVENSDVVKDIISALNWVDLIEPTDNPPWIVGTDVTLLYSKKEFELVGTPTSHNVHNLYATRDIFEVTLRHNSGEELIVLANHWPSRRISNSEPLRIGLSDHCRQIVNVKLKISYTNLSKADGSANLPEYSILYKQWNRPLLVVGDFNDEPFNVSASEYLEVTRSKDQVTKKPRLPRKSNLTSISSYMSLKPDLYNPSWSLLVNQTGPAGTTFWSGNWYLLDHIMVSRGLLGNNSKLQYNEHSLRIFADKKVPNIKGGSDIKFLTSTGKPVAYDAKTGKGVSDHLPLVWEMVVK